MSPDVGLFAFYRLDRQCLADQSTQATTSKTASRHEVSVSPRRAIQRFPTVAPAPGRVRPKLSMILELATSMKSAVNWCSQRDHPPLERSRLFDTAF